MIGKDRSIPEELGLKPPQIKMFEKQPKAEAQSNE